MRLYFLRGLTLSALIVSHFLVSRPAAAAVEQVDIKLVLAVDVSGNIDDDEFRLEREGTALTFLDPDVISAIQSGTLGRIAVAMVDFSMAQYNKIVINWHVIHDCPSAVGFAQILRKTPRTLGHRTSISSALETGLLMLEARDKDFVATRKVIDVSGDGPNNAGDKMTPVRQKTIVAGIVVNGLPVMDEEAGGYFPGLDKYYAACEAGGPGSFVVVVRNYRDSAAGMRCTLILEISQNETSCTLAQSHPELIPIAAVGGSSGPEVLQPAPNAFANRCDLAGGPYGFGNF
jgi:Protein of unknown function (DUF1194)